MQQRSDEILMKDLQKGDMDSLGILYSRYKTKLFNYFLNVTQDRDLASDLLMEVFERVYQYRKSFKSNRNFKPWLYQIANNRMKDEFRKKQKDDRFNKEYSDVPTSQTESHGSEVEQLIKLALSKLNEKDRRLLSMYYLLEMSYTDIAELEKTSVNSIRIRVCRSLKLLNNTFKEIGIDKI